MLVEAAVDMGVSHNKGTLNWGPYNKDPTIWGTILGSPIFGNPHMKSHPGVRASALGLSVVEAWYPEAEPRLLPKPLEGCK